MCQINIVEERLSSDGGTQDRPSIPGLSGDMANQDKKNKNKNKENKNSEEASKEAKNMAATQTQGRLISLKRHCGRLQVGKGREGEGAVPDTSGWVQVTLEKLKDSCIG